MKAQIGDIITYEIKGKYPSSGKGKVLEILPDPEPTWEAYDVEGENQLVFAIEVTAVE
jgi:hypothetical protein